MCFFKKRKQRKEEERLAAEQAEKERLEQEKIEKEKAEKEAVAKEKKASSKVKKETKKEEIVEEVEVVEEETVEETEQTSAEATEKKTRKAVYRVVFDKEDSLWKIKKDGAKRIIASYKTKQEALDKVQSLSKNQEINFVVMKKDGKFQKKANLKLKSDKKEN